MTEAKQFKTLLVASLASDFAHLDTNVEELRELATHVLGRPIFSHQLADHAISDEISAAIIAQFPNMPTKADAKHNPDAAAGKAVVAYGEFVLVEPGKDLKKGGPISDLTKVSSGGGSE